VVVKFLVIRLSSIGDIVLTTPVIRCLKQQVEGASVHFLTKTSFRTILENNPYVDKLHLFDGKMNEMIEELKKEEFDYIIDLHRNLRSYMIKSRLGTISFSFDKINLQKYLITTFKINKLPDKHIVDRYLETIHHFDIINDHKGLDYFIPDHDKILIEKILPKLHHAGYVGFVIGAKHETKKLFPEKIVYLLNGIKKPVVLLGGKEDRDTGEFIAKTVNGNVFNACGLFNLNQSASLVEQARVIVTHDTGLMHIAAAFKKKIVSVWGNTIPEFGMSPYEADNKSMMVEVKGLPCRPCSKLGYKKCPKGHFRCMKEIDEKVIIDYVEKNF
jgi:ADP-heptose:LPS heptosyltransferase